MIASWSRSARIALRKAYAQQAPRLVIVNDLETVIKQQYLSRIHHCEQLQTVCLEPCIPRPSSATTLFVITRMRVGDAPGACDDLIFFETNQHMRLTLKIRSGQATMAVADFLRSRLLYLDVRRSTHR